LILVPREDLATGAGSLSSAELGGIMIGRSVLRASGSRRVKNKVEACRYVLDTGEGRLDPEDDREEMDEARRPFPKDSLFDIAGLNEAV
jgi:hypothetical protein